MSMLEPPISVRLKAGHPGQVTHCAGHRFDLSLKPGEVATQWGNGAPITLREFSSVLEPAGLFEIANPQPPASAPVQTSTPTSAPAEKKE